MTYLSAGGYQDGGTPLRTWTVWEPGTTSCGGRRVLVHQSGATLHYAGRIEKLAILQLAVVPLVLDSLTWAKLESAAATQRLLETVLCDLSASNNY